MANPKAPRSKTRKDNQQFVFTPTAEFDSFTSPKVKSIATEEYLARLEAEREKANGRDWNDSSLEFFMRFWVQD